MWLKADQGVTLDGNGRVSQWNDQSTIARHVTQSVTSQRPLYIASAQNGKPGIQFVTSRQDILESTTSTGIDDCSIFTVMRLDGSDATEDLIISIAKGNDLGRGRFLYRPSSSTKINFATWGNDFTSGTIDYDTGNYHVIGVTLSGLSLTLFRDTTVQTGVIASNPVLTSQSYWGIGGSSITGFGNYYSNCTISEVIIYDRAVSTNERTQITAYLKARWATP